MRRLLLVSPAASYFSICFVRWSFRSVLFASSSLIAVLHTFLWAFLAFLQSGSRGGMVISLPRDSMLDWISAVWSICVVSWLI